MVRMCVRWESSHLDDIHLCGVWKNCDASLAGRVKRIDGQATETVKVARSGYRLREWYILSQRRCCAVSKPGPSKITDPSVLDTSCSI